MTEPDERRLAPAELATLFLFEALEPDQLSWLSERGRVRRFAAGQPVFVEGQPATCFFVLLEGTLSMHRRVEGTDVELSRTAQRGVYAGATSAFVAREDATPYLNSVFAVTDCTFWVVDAAPFGERIRAWFPMTTHMLEGLTLGMRNSQAVVGQRERLLSLGRLTAGLTHELNNPAAAAVRATAVLRERVAKMRGKLAHLAGAEVDPKAWAALTGLQDAALQRQAELAGSAAALTGLAARDAEDALTDWLDEREVADAWDLAPTLAGAGLDSRWLEEVAAALPAELLPDGVRWVAYALETEQLMAEIEDSTRRISALVGAARQYSQLDRAAQAEVDLRDGLGSTLVMLNTKIKEAGIRVVKEFDPELPVVPAYPAELNQVWTNLIDNAIHAMSGGEADPDRTLTVRTARQDGSALVEIADTGSGIPANLQGKIFEPFFTTKPVGEGTGLGLDISYRVVTQRHGGDLSVTSEPGNTRFRVRLPLTEPSPDARVGSVSR